MGQGLSPQETPTGLWYPPLQFVSRREMEQESSRSKAPRDNQIRTGSLTIHMKEKIQYIIAKPLWWLGWKIQNLGNFVHGRKNKLRVNTDKDNWYTIEIGFRATAQEAEEIFDRLEDDTKETVCGTKAPYCWRDHMMSMRSESMEELLKD